VLLPLRRFFELSAAARAQVLKIPDHARRDALDVGNFVAAKLERILHAGLSLFESAGSVRRAGKCKNDQRSSNPACKVWSDSCHGYLLRAFAKIHGKSLTRIGRADGQDL